MEIDTKKLKLKIGEYVGEFYHKPETLKNFNHPFLKSLIDMLTNEIKNSMILEELKDLNSLMIKGNSNNGLACLKQSIKVQSVLGEGAYGKVYKINNKKAAKIVPLGTHFIWDEINKLKENILNEFAICKLAGELGVGPKVYDHYSCCDEKNQCYYILYMDLLNGKNLYDWLDDKPSVEEQEYVKKILIEKLEVLHKNNIIHNDLHRGNVFVVNKRNGKEKSNIEDVFIIDYGLATNFKRKMKQTISFENKMIDYLFSNNEIKNNDIYNYVVIRLLDNNDIKITI